MAVAALGLFAVYLLLGFGLRTWVQWRRTGDTGFRGISGRPDSSPWWAGVLFVVALVAGVAGPITGLSGLDPLWFMAAPWLYTDGAVAAVVGIVATVLTQLTMGVNWRIGVDEAEATELVVAGAFALVRNPIFAAMAVTGVGLALMVPNVVGVGGVVLLLVALQIQVRVVEEPYLRRTHGDRYAAYAASTGRFLPGVGRDRAVAAKLVPEVAAASEVQGGGR